MTQNPAIKAAIAAANETFMATFGKGDAAGMAALYTDDAQMMPPTVGFMTGKPAIQAFWQAVMDMGIKGTRLRIETREVEQHGDTAIEVSEFQALSADGTVLDNGKDIKIWKHIGGQWKLHRGIFNSSRAPAG